MGFAELAVVLEELGRTLAPEPFLSTVLLAGQALLLAGSEAQQKQLARPAVAGDAILALAQQERGSRYDLHRVATRAERAGAASGSPARRSRCSTAASPTRSSWSRARAGAERRPRGITLFLVPAGAPGLRVERQSRVDSRSAALVRLDGARSARTRCSARGEGAPVLEEVVDRATVGLCAEMLGSMSRPSSGRSST